MDGAAEPTTPGTGLGLWVAIGVVLLFAVFQFLLSQRQGSTQKEAEAEDSGPEGEDASRQKQGQKGKRSAAASRGKGHGTEKDHQHHPLDLNTLKGHSDAVTGLAFSSDGNGLATACADGAVRVFKLEDVTAKSFKFLRINLPAGMTPLGVAFGSAGSSELVVSGSDPSGSCLCLVGPPAADSKAAAEARAKGKLPAPEVKWERKRAHDGRGIISTAGAISSFGTARGDVVVATSSEATDVKIWATSDGKCISTVDSNQLRNTMALLSPDGRFLAVAAFTADVKIWELVYGRDGSVSEVLRVMQLKGHASAVTWLDFSGDSQRVVTASKDGTIKIWNINVRYHLNEDPKCLKTIPIPPLPSKSSSSSSASAKPALLLRIAACPNGSLLAAAFGGGGLVWIDLDKGAVVEEADHAHDGAIECMMWSSRQHSIDGVGSYILATTGVDKKVKLWREPKQ